MVRIPGDLRKQPLRRRPIAAARGNQPLREQRRQFQRTVLVLVGKLEGLLAEALRLIEMSSFDRDKSKFRQGDGGLILISLLLGES